MNRHKAPVIGMLLVAALLLISSLGAGVQAASWHTIQTDIQSTNVLYPVMVWDGGGANNLASTAANWVGDVAPYEGCIIIFNGTSTKACTWDITATMYSISINSGYSGTVTLSCDTTVADDVTVNAGILNGGTSYNLTVGGDFTKGSSGTITADTTNLVFSPAGTSVLSGFVALRSFTTVNGGSVSTNTGFQCSYSFVNPGILTVNSPGYVNIAYYTAFSGPLSNTGTITGSGYFRVTLYNSDKSMSMGGTITIPFEIYLHSSAAANRTLSLGAAHTFSDLTISSASSTYYIICNENGQTLTVSNMYVSSKGIYKNDGALGSVTYFDKFTVKSGGSIDGSKLYMYILPSGTLNVPSGTSIYRVYFKTYAGGTITNPITATNQFRFGFLQSNTYYKVLVNGIRSSSLYGTSDATGNLVFGSGSQSAGTYTLMSGADAWHSIQSDSQIGFTFAVTTWHIIQNDSKSMYFDPYDFHTIQADSIEYRIGQLVHAQYFNGTIESSGSAPVIQPGTNTESNVMGIIWLLIFFIPAIILFAYLGKLGGTLGLVIMSVISVMAFDMGIFIMIVGIISSVIIMVESDGGD